ncbi:hypothetical protein CONPUDRAFT_160605 [Coniophora puteana RWD-64-598 SS2]|uniref:Uncharacterized protein n=1 Tax=Coniophora puteana (strain RWD-64-598) TaxID=741705 RepID=R7SFM4_CONPW|nr:uncharacterized protein CONPUDRAFT_160605 [Coniophora puteana RWD-64-598 SS2]EIW73884.1 hypothetical protein CONPUDRAFT_160605 [Coniophora puteana RWD-64-598 SS2]
MLVVTAPPPPQLGKYPAKSRTTKARRPYRWRSKPTFKTTPAQRKALAIRRKSFRLQYRDALKECRSKIRDMAKKLRERFGKHSEDHYYREILQDSRLVRHARKISRWNVYQRQEMKRLNSEQMPGQKRKNAGALVAGIAQAWKVLTPEEKVAFTDPLMADMQENRDNKELAAHNAPLAAFQDTDKTTKSIASELRKLHVRTGDEVILIVARSNVDHYNEAYTFTTPRVKGFVDSSLNTSIQNLATRFEGYCISGVKVDATAPCKPPRMFYTNFDIHITDKYHTLLENWPAARFISPSDMNSHELDVVFNAFATGLTFFRRMSDEEYQQWAKLRVSQAVDDVPESPTATSSASLPPSEDLGSTNANMNTACPPAASSPVDCGGPQFTGVTQNGEAMVIKKKQRKPRADIGKPRGPQKNPHKKKSTTNASAVDTVTTT